MKGNESKKEKGAKMMKKKKSKVIGGILLLILILGGIFVGYQYKGNLLQVDTKIENSTVTVKQVEVSTQTITKTLTSSGQISSATTEDLALNTYRYFKECDKEENQFVAKGETIVKYTNGTYLTAPYDCVITKLSLPEDSGDRCTSQHYVQIQTTENLLMTLTIEEEEIGKIATGQEVEISVNAYEDKKYKGEITKINEIGTYATNGSSFTAIVKFENDGMVKIGMSASATITLEKAENVIAVPIEAVQKKKNQTYVVVKKEDGTTQDVVVETGISNDAYVEIKSGLTQAQTIQMTEVTQEKNNTRGQGGFNPEFGNGQKNTPQGGQMPTMPSSREMKAQ